MCASLAATGEIPRRFHHTDMSSATTTGYPLYMSTELPDAQYHECQAVPDYTPFTVAEAALLEVIVDGHPLAIPLLVRVSFCGGYYEIQHEDLALFGTGKTQAEAVEDFVAFLVADFRHYALASTEDLDPASQELAATYRRLFGMRA